MKIAYIVLAHKNIRQIRCLLEAIQDDDASIYLHIDRSAGKKVYQEAVGALADIKNLTYLYRHSSNWGGFGLVKATMEGVRACLVDQEIKYAILLSGQDYPIKSKIALQSFLKANYGKSFMEVFPFPHPLWKDHGGYDRIKRWYFSVPIKQTRLIKRFRSILNQTMNILKPDRKFPVGFEPYGGAQWWCLHRDCLEYIERFFRANKSFVNFFKTVRIPDELIFHTILMNSSLQSKIINRKLTYVDWNANPGPKFLNDNDLEEIIASDEFFARKFDLELTPNIYYSIKLLSDVEETM